MQRQIAYRHGSCRTAWRCSSQPSRWWRWSVLFGVVAWPPSPAHRGRLPGVHAAFGQVIGAAVSLVQASTAICQAAPAYERARPILLTQPRRTRPRADPGELSGEIELRRVSFRYGVDGPLVLTTCRSTVARRVRRARRPIRLGKSTLLRLLLGFEAPAAGCDPVRRPGPCAARRTRGAPADRHRAPERPAAGR